MDFEIYQHISVPVDPLHSFMFGLFKYFHLLFLRRSRQHIWTKVFWRRQIRNKGFSYENGFTHRKEPHLLGGTRVSVFGLVLLREVRSQECRRTRGVGELRWLVRSLVGTGQMTRCQTIRFVNKNLFQRFNVDKNTIANV